MDIMALLGQYVFPIVACVAMATMSKIRETRTANS